MNESNEFLKNPQWKDRLGHFMALRCAITDFIYPFPIAGMPII
jgi:hypothetical protein